MLVSVVIPCFNVQDYISECLDSVFSQTYTNIEVICIDNNSTDNTFSILQDYKEKYPILVIDKETTPGAPAARNKGLWLAKGEWIQFLDADDLLLSEKIKHQINLFKNKNNNSAKFIAAASIKIDNKGFQKINQIENNALKGVFSSNLGNTCANFFNRIALNEIGGWNTDLQSSQEYELMFRLIKKFGSPIIDTNPLTIIRDRVSGQISQRNPKEKWHQYLNLRIHMLEYIKEKKPLEWMNNKDYFLNKFFTKLRLYAIEDLQNSQLIFSQTFPDNFIPEKSKYITGKYIFLFKVLGFKKTEQILSFLKLVLKKQ